MKNKGFIIFFTILVSVLCLFYLSFTYLTQRKERQAVAYATDANGVFHSAQKQKFLDSIWKEPVYNFLGIKYTYQEIKESALHLGLDLQGGMHITLEIAPAEIVKVLAGGNSSKPAFVTSLQKATEAQQKGETDFVKIFYASYKQLEPNITLARLFSNSMTRGKIKFNTSDEEVLQFLRTEIDNAIDRSFNILRNRIDKFGVVQPNIQRLQATSRIQIELPGVDDPERVRNLLKGVAKLEFYEVWDPKEIGPILQSVNDIAFEKEKLTLATEKSKLNVSADTLKSTNSSTENALEKQLTQKKINKDSTAVDSTNAKASSLLTLIRSPYGLIYELKDTAKIQRLFRLEEVKRILPPDLKLAWSVKPIKSDGKEEGLMELHFLKQGREGQPALAGDVVNDASQQIDTRGKGFAVLMQMNTAGAKQWKRITADNIGRRIAIVLDDYVYSAPVVQSEIPDGISTITGNFSIEESKDLVNVLKTGKLPAPVHIVEEAIVGPSLGKEAVQQGLVSIVIGFIMVILFMFIIYSSAGAVANIAVIFNVFFLLGILASLGAALTLPGIAGILLTIGMAVDANVLINERVKEELAEGKSLRTAIGSGYKNAFSAIMDSNITTIIAGVVLLIFGTGLIYGFAVTLIIGILCSLFTAILITRIIFEFFLKKEKNISFSNKRTKNLLRKTNIDFIGKRKYYYIGSSLIIIAGLISIAIKGFNLGVDFKGGRTYIVQFDHPVSSSEVRQSLAHSFGSAPEVKTFGTADKLKVTTSYLIDQDSDDAVKQAESKLKEGLSQTKSNFKVLSSSKVGPTIANDTKTSAVWSIIIALIGMFIYILIRFKKWQFALGGIISLIHDVLIVIAFFTLLQDVVPFALEVDQAFVAAILTVIGYSINDSVVVFDRIREFLQSHSTEKDTGKVINHALNDTLSRTLITGMTTIFVIAILFLFGGETIKGFSFAMLIGVLIGTYSSICIGSPIVLDFKKKQKNG